MPTPETLENILIQFTQHQFSMFPTESAIDQFLPPSGFLGFQRMLKGLGSLVVRASGAKLEGCGSIPRRSINPFHFVL